MPETRCDYRQAACEVDTILHLVGLARSKQDPIHHGHGAQYLQHPPPAGGMQITHEKHDGYCEQQWRQVVVGIEESSEDASSHQHAVRG